MRIEKTDRDIIESIELSAMAESVEIPADDYSLMLKELLALRKFALDVQALFECRDGLLQADGECGERIGKLMLNAAEIAHALRYAGIEP